MNEINLNERTLEIIDNAINELYELLKDKSDGVGVIRINEFGQPISEFYSSLESLQKAVDMNKNLVVIHVKDNISRKNIRTACFIRLNIMKNENKNS